MRHTHTVHCGLHSSPPCVRVVPCRGCVPICVPCCPRPATHTAVAVIRHLTYICVTLCAKFTYTLHTVDELLYDMSGRKLSVWGVASRACLQAARQGSHGRRYRRGCRAGSSAAHPQHRVTRRGPPAESCARGRATRGILKGDEGRVQPGRKRAGKERCVEHAPLWALWFLLSINYFRKKKKELGLQVFLRAVPRYPNLL